MSLIWHRRMGLSANSDTAPETTGAEFSQPIRAPTFESDVVVPFAQASVTGLLFGCLIAAVADWLGLTPFWPFAAPACLFAVAVAWLWRLNTATDSIHKIESYTGLDLDRDGKVGKVGSPTTVPVVLDAEPIQAARQTAEERAEANFRAALTRFVTDTAHFGTASRHWEPKIGRPRYEQYRDLLLKMGAAAWNNPRDPRAGWKLTAAPAAICKQIGG